MFISSYATYVSTNLTERPERERSTTQRTTKTFSSVITKNTPIQAYNPKNFPIDYISNYKSLNNQQKLEAQISDNKNPLSKNLKDFTGAKLAYESNTVMFSLIKKPKVALNQNLKVSDIYPQNIQELKENNLRDKMVNIYLENDRYHQITA